MRKRAGICLALVISMTLVVPSAFAESKKATRREPDSEYVAKERASKRREGGGLFDFLPFIGTRPSRVESEKLKPSPGPRSEEVVPLTLTAIPSSVNVELSPGVGPRGRHVEGRIDPPKGSPSKASI